MSLGEGLIWTGTYFFVVLLVGFLAADKKRITTADSRASLIVALMVTLPFYLIALGIRLVL